MNLPKRYREIFDRYNREILIVEKKVRNFEIKRERLIRREEYATEFEVNEIEMQRKISEEEEEIEKEYFKKSEFYVDDESEKNEKEKYDDIDLEIDDDYGMNAEDVVKALSLLKDESEDEFWDGVDIFDDDLNENIEYDEELLDDDLLYLDDLSNRDAKEIEEYDCEDEYGEYEEPEREYGMDMEIDMYTPNPDGKNVKPVEKIYEFSNGDIYIGKMINNKMHGMGNYIFYSEREIKNEYVGEFKNNNREGKGLYKFSNGDEYTGNFKREMANGIGRMNYNSGAEYLGEWRDSRKEGYGFYQWKDGEMYIGEFKGGKFNGRGSCFDRVGNLIYEGYWINNVINGKGRFIWEDGKSYEGDFKEGKKHGEGTFYDEDGEILYRGTWENDKPIIFGMSFEEVFSGRNED